MLSQKWKDLCFIHYRIDKEQLRSRIPAELEIDEFDGSAWIAVVPFRMQDIRPRFLPAVSAISTFPELNVRTYVRNRGKSGVWFFSLDCPSRIAVRFGRGLLGLPYNLSDTTQTVLENEIRFESRRKGFSGSFEATYQGTSAPVLSAKGSFEEWSTERYCLFTAPARDRIVKLEVHHPRWRLSRCELDQGANNLFANEQLVVKDTAPHVVYSPGVDIVSYSGDPT